MKNFKKYLVILLLSCISFAVYAAQLKSAHVVAAVQNCPSKSCQVFNANGESFVMDMKGKILDTLTTGDSVVIKGQQYSVEGTPQIFITGGNLFSGGRDQFAFVHITQKTTA